MIHECKPKKMALYINTARKTIAAVQRETGADIVINGGLFNGAFQPVMTLKLDGKYLALEDIGYWGYAWNKAGGDIHFTQDHRAYDNFITCITLWKDKPFSYPADMGGVRGRTALGFKPDGRCVIYCAADGSSGAMSPEALRDHMYAMGCANVIMLDGGGSSQGIFPGERVTASRIVQNLICIWEEKPMKICLDPGHGLAELNQSPDGTYFEHEFALDMANRVRGHLLRNGLEVLLTREDSSTPALAARAQKANDWGADLFVSLHSNAVAGGWAEPSGLTVWTYAAGGERERAAKLILSEAKAAGVATFGSELYHASFAVLALTSMPACLIEYAFHTNRADVALLKSADYRAKLAEFTAKAIVSWCGMAWVPAPAPPSGGTIYRVQTGAFADESNALRMAEALRAQGYSTVVKSESK